MNQYDNSPYFEKGVDESFLTDYFGDQAQARVYEGGMLVTHLTEDMARRKMNEHLDSVIEPAFLADIACTEDQFRGRVEYLIKKHPSLRADLIVNEAGKYYLIFRKEGQADCFYRDIRHLADPDSPGQISPKQKAYFSAYYHMKLDEVQHRPGLIPHFYCFRLKDSLCLFGIMVSHLVSDGESVKLLGEELLSQGPGTGEKDHLYAWLRTVGDPLPAEVTAFWQSYLYGRPVTGIPFTGPGKEGYDSGNRIVEFDQKEYDLLSQYSRKHKVTPIECFQYIIGQSLLDAFDLPCHYMCFTVSCRESIDDKLRDSVAYMGRGRPLFIERGQTLADFAFKMRKIRKFSYSRDEDTFHRFREICLKPDSFVMTFMTKSLTEEMRPQGGVDYPFGALLRIGDGGIILDFRWNRNLYSEETIDLFIDTMKRRLSETIKGNLYWEKLPLDSTKERLLRISREVPARAAISYRKGDAFAEVTYSALWKDMEKLGSWLERENLTDHRRIVLIGTPSYEWILTALTVLGTNSMLIPLNDGLSSEELTELLERIRPDIIFYEEGQERKWAGSCRAYSFSSVSELEADSDSSYSLLPADPDRPALVIFTSGSTGRAKGVVHTERSLLVQTQVLAECPGMLYTEMLNVPLFHMMGFSAIMHLSLCMGVGLYVSGGGRYLFDEIQKIRPVALKLTPLQARLLSEAVKDMSTEEFIEFSGGRIQEIVATGAPLEPPLRKHIEELGLHPSNGYGMTEAGGGITIEYGETPAGSVGPLHPCFDYKIDHPDSEGYGVLYLSGPSVFAGYLDDPEETEKVLKEGWLKTGDVAKIDKNGYLFLRGRADNLIVLQTGENVSPEPVEKKISLIPGVIECLVFEEKGALAVRIYPKADVSQEEIQTALIDLNKDFSRNEKISYIYFSEEPLERTATGKLKRR